MLYLSLDKAASEDENKPIVLIFEGSDIKKIAHKQFARSSHKTANEQILIDKAMQEVIAVKLETVTENLNFRELFFCLYFILQQIFNAF